MNWLLAHLSDLTVGLFVGVILVLNGLLGRYRDRYYEALEKAIDLKRERDCLAHWLRVNGWLVSYEANKVVVERDPEP